MTERANNVLLLNSVRPDTKITEGRARFHPPVTLEDLRNATERGDSGGGGGQDDSVSCVHIHMRDSHGANSKDHPSHAAPSGNVDVGAFAAKGATVTDAVKSGGGVHRNAVDRGAQHKLRPGDSGCVGGGGTAGCFQDEWGAGIGR